MEHMTGQDRKENPIVVLGATGTTGSRVAALLEDAGRVVRRASRRSEWRFDWGDPASWGPVVSGAAGVYVVLPEEPMDLHPFIETLDRAGVPQVVVLTARNPEVSGDGIAAGAERVFAAADAASTFLRPSWFSQGFIDGLFAAQLDATGELRLPTGDGGEPFIDAADIAGVAARLFLDRTGPTHVELSGPEVLTFADAVEIVARRTGRTLRYVHVEPAEWAASVADYLPPRMVGALGNLFAAIRDGRDAYLSPGVSEVLGVPPQSLGAVVDRSAESRR